jgi:hypothetical protein
MSDASPLKRLKQSMLSDYRKSVAEMQGGLCAICRHKMEEVCLDHDHKTGEIRSALCRNCNGIEGKIFNLCRRGKRDKTPMEYLVEILDYWKFWADNPRHVLHPKHRTDEEKRIKRNKKARERRANKSSDAS